MARIEFGDMASEPERVFAPRNTSGVYVNPDSISVGVNSRKIEPEYFVMTMEGLTFNYNRSINFVYIESREVEECLTATCIPATLAQRVRGYEHNLYAVREAYRSLYEKITPRAGYEHYAWRQHKGTLLHQEHQERSYTYQDPTLTSIGPFCIPGIFGLKDTFEDDLRTINLPGLRTRRLESATPLETILIRCDPGDVRDIEIESLIDAGRISYFDWPTKSTWLIRSPLRIGEIYRSYKYNPIVWQRFKKDNLKSDDDELFKSVADMPVGDIADFRRFWQAYASRFLYLMGRNTNICFESNTFPPYMHINQITDSAEIVDFEGRSASGAHIVDTVASECQDYFLRMSALAGVDNKLYGQIKRQFWQGMRGVEDRLTADLL